MPELIAQLRTMRADLVERMARDLADDGARHAWLPLLAEVVVEEGSRG